MKKLTEAELKSQDFEAMIDLLAHYSEAANRLEEIQASVNGEFLSIIDDEKQAYAQAQAALTEAETALEFIARMHPEWFKTRQSIKTPYGTVKFRASSALEIPNEEATIILIHQAESTDNTMAARELVKTQEVIDKEALEELDDATLKRLRVKRVAKLNFSVDPAKVDMGKAVKSAMESA